MPPELDEDQGAAPVPETAEIPVAEAPEADAGGEAPEIPEEAAAGAPEGSGEPAPEEPAKPSGKKTVEKLTGRIGHLTKTLHEKDEEIASERRRREALEALLNRGAESDDTPAVHTPTQDAPRPGTPEFASLVQEEAKRFAAADRFNADCNAIFDSGKEKHGAEFEEAVTNLNALGVMNPALVEAAMATDAPADVIHALGSDLDEAARITALPPIRMAAEIVKLSTKLSAAKPGGQVSRVPPPITPVGGQSSASLDVYDPNLSMDEYVRRRASQGARFAKK